MKDLTTTKCGECFYFKNILGVKTCGLYHKVLGNNVVGCFNGWKERNIEVEKQVR